MEEATLKDNEPHPASTIALNFIREQGFTDWCILKEALASCAIEDNRLAEICLSTVNRLEKGEPVSDRYLMGLAWMVYRINKGKE